MHTNLEGVQTRAPILCNTGAVASAHFGNAEYIKTDGDTHGEYVFHAEMLLERVVGRLMVDCVDEGGSRIGGMGWMRVWWYGC